MSVLLGSINLGIGAFETIPATLQKLVNSKRLYVAPLNFRMRGGSSKGYAIFNKDGVELAEIEPYMGRDYKFIVRHKYDKNLGTSYKKNMRDVVSSLRNLKDKSNTGYKFSGYKQYI